MNSSIVRVECPIVNTTVECLTSSFFFFKPAVLIIQN